MLHVLLVILKVAGIVFLSILLVLLLLLLLVLFVPIRYRGYAKKDSEVYVKATASWMFHIIHFNFYYDRDGMRQVLRIFGIPIDKVKVFFGKLKSIFQFKTTNNKKSKKVRKRNTKKVRTRTDKTNQISVNVGDKELNQLDVSLEKEPSLPTKEFEVKNEKIDQTTKNSYNHNKTSNVNELDKKVATKRKKKKHKFSIKKWFIRIKDRRNNFIQKIKNLIRKIIFFFKNTKDKVDGINSILQDERNREAFKVCKNQLIIALKHVRPKKYKIYVKFGTGDPALTGQVLGILGMLMPLYKNNVIIIPDFENAILEGDVYLKGRITIAKVLWIALKLYRDENVMRCYKMIMD